MPALHDRDPLVRKLGQVRAARRPRLDPRVRKRGVRQAEPELEARRDAPPVKGPVVDQQALGEVGLGEGDVSEGRRGVEEVPVVGLGAGDGVGQAPRGVDVAVEDGGEGVARLLARQAGEEGRGDVGVGDPCVDGADAFGTG